MARFLGSASGRTAGSSAATGGFTKAKVFSTAGTTTFTIPNDATKAKAFVVGAGSSLGQELMHLLVMLALQVYLIQYLVIVLVLLGI